MGNADILKKKVSEENNPEAFKELYDYYFNPLFNIGYSILQNREIAKELVSDVFISLWNSRQNLSNIENLDNYLFVAIRNQCLRYLKRNKMEKYTDSIHENYYTKKNIDFNSPDKVVEFEELKLRYDKVITTLPTKCKKVFELVKDEGKKYKEVADIMTISIKTVENHMLKAMKLLREEFKKDHKSVEKDKVIL
ncbi:RNA polymerase sigma-70 factor [Chondrinema litorale]|uniref:RNA polymerase sigma-70 factor n=1 Tax=Chondrinema litorale TaxID=2994555 RepID=UPI0025427C41|nr:RNA polymerase sigma-70 factor [Chondrinema litorale]UZR96503.1 RNA polymerase sigma-70 factor [Chondrinema litorale]